MCIDMDFFDYFLKIFLPNSCLCQKKVVTLQPNCLGITYGQNSDILFVA